MPQPPKVSAMDQSLAVHALQPHVCMVDEPSMHPVWSVEFLFGGPCNKPYSLRARGLIPKTDGKIKQSL